MDRALACAVLLLAAPSLAVRAVVALLRTGRTLVSRSVVDRDGRPFQLYAFAGERGTSDLLDLIAVVAGRMRFIGPRPLTSDEARALPAESPVSYTHLDVYKRQIVISPSVPAAGMALSGTGTLR